MLDPITNKLHFKRNENGIYFYPIGFRGFCYQLIDEGQYVRLSRTLNRTYDGSSWLIMLSVGHWSFLVLFVIAIIWVGVDIRSKIIELDLKRVK